MSSELKKLWKNIFQSCRRIFIDLGVYIKPLLPKDEKSLNINMKNNGTYGY